MLPILLVVLAVPTAAGVPDGGAPAPTPVEAQLRHAFQRLPVLADDDIHVSVTGLLLTLTGSVDSERDRDTAVAMARDLAHPRQMVVEDLLRVRLPSPTLDGDAAPRLHLQEQLRRKIAALPGVSGVRVDVVQVPRLRVMLRGQVPSDRVRRQILEIISSTPEAEELQDELRVAPRTR